MADPVFDIDRPSREALGFDELLAMVAQRARTEVGSDRLLDLHPLTDSGSVSELHALVEELRARLESGGALVGRSIPDPRPALSTLGSLGAVLEGAEARRLALALASARSIRRALLNAEPESLLGAFGREMPDLGELGEEVLRGTEPDGSLTDAASRELADLRRRHGVVAERIRRQLLRHLRRPDAQSVIRDDFITRRNERFVIPVRTDAPKPVQGIVHGGSSSGATRFVEPLETVESNNELVALVDAEREEIQRILARWTDALRGGLQEIRRAVDAMAELDSLQARAMFAIDVQGIVPQVGEGQRLELHEFRHPILERRLREEQATCVPTTIRLEEGHSVLVLSGPNTGGKTVALKAIGLGVLMAQCGIPVPARSLSMPCFRQLRADIGDHQSIAANLSTFSSHIGMVARSLAERVEPALFLFDELGTGTEPSEGAALARAILEQLLESNVTVVATSHLSPVKLWASTTPGVASAAMEFDSETLSPTYRVQMGAAGGSAGLDIAGRLGVDPAIVRRARELVNPSIREAEQTLAELRRSLQEAEQTREQLREQLQQLHREQADARQRMERDREEVRGEASTRLARELEQYRKRIRKELAGIDDEKERARLTRRGERGERRLQAEKRRVESDLTPRSPDRAEALPLAVDELVTGARVVVTSLGREGVIAGVRGEEAEVQLGGMSLRVERSELSRASRGPEEDGQDHGRRVRAAAPSAPSCAPELVLVGKRVEEALDELVRYLDAALWAERSSVRIVHGHGTGRLRIAVRRFLADHPSVRGHRAGRDGEGGDAATIVDLA